MTDNIESSQAPTADQLRYIRVLFGFIRESAAKIRKRRMASDDPDNDLLNLGQEGAFLNVLLAMQTFAPLHDIDKEAAGMADFDPLTDELDPAIKPPSKPG